MDVRRRKRLLRNDHSALSLMSVAELPRARRSSTGVRGTQRRDAPKKRGRANSLFIAVEQQDEEYDWPEEETREHPSARKPPLHVCSDASCDAEERRDNEKTADFPEQSCIEDGQERLNLAHCPPPFASGWQDPMAAPYPMRRAPAAAK